VASLALNSLNNADQPPRADRRWRGPRRGV